MIDASKSPIPAWRRYGTILVLVALLVGAAVFVWTKELHHSLTGLSNPPARSAPPAPAVVSHHKATPTTVPGGIVPSNRDPFGG